MSISTPGSAAGQSTGSGDPRILRADGRPLRVTFCPVNTAGVPWTTAEALRGRGVDARLVVFNRYALHPEADRSLDLEGGLLRRQGRQWRELRQLLPETDIFHFVFGLTLVPQSLQFPILRAYGKRSVFHYLGSDIRGKTPDQLKFGKKADGEIVGSYDAIRWVPEATVIPPGIDVRSIVPSPPSRHDRPVVVHAPSSRERKGTARVIEACAGLDVDLQIVEGLHHAEAFERYRNADIIVDQLHAGWYGLFAIECMALGKPVVTFLHDEAVRRTEEAYEIPVPIVNASPEDLHNRIAELVALGPEGRVELGARSRAYVERVHDLERVTDRLLDLYAATLERDPARRKQAVRAVAERAPLAPPEPEEFGLDQADLETGMPTAVASRQTADDLGGGIGAQLRRLSKHSAIYGIGGLVSRIIAVILLPLYTRYLTPGDYGNIETLLALTTIMGLLLRAGITSAFFRFYFDAHDEPGRLQVLRTSFWFTMGAATLGLLALVIFAAPIADSLLGDASGANLVRAAGVALWAGVNYEQLTALFRVEERSTAFVIASLANVFITIGATLVLVVQYQEGAMGVIVGNFTGTLAVYLTLLGYRREQLGLSFDRHLLRQMNKFGLPLVPTAVFLWTTNFSDRFFIRQLATVADPRAEVGLYSVGVRIASAMVLLLTAFRTAWPAFAYSIQDDGEARRTYAFVLTYLTVITSWAALLLTLLSPWLVDVLNHDFARASTVVGPLAFSTVSYGAYIVIAIGVGRIRRTQFNWVVTGLGALVNFALNVVLIPRYGMMGAAIATVAAYTTMAVGMAWWSQRIYPVPYQWRRTLIAVLAAVGLAAFGKIAHVDLALALFLTLVYPLVLLAMGFALPGERARLRAVVLRR